MALKIEFPPIRQGKKDTPIISSPMLKKVVIPVISGGGSASQPNVADANPENPEPAPAIQAQNETIAIVTVWSDLLGLKLDRDRVSAHLAKLRQYETRRKAV